MTTFRSAIFRLIRSFFVIQMLAFSIFAQPCDSPATPFFTFTPPGNVGVDETYTIAWNDTTTGIDDVFLVERSTSSSFASILDSQEVLEPAASFVVATEGKYYHRVKAVPACDPTLASAYSSPSAVNVIAGAASVVVTVQPKPLITNLGDSLTGKKSRIVLENLTKRPVTVLITEREIGDSPSFFRVSDPAGGNLLNLTLEPGTPKSLEISFEGFGTSETARRSYQGVIVVIGSELAVIPYAFVNLKIGGSESATPFFRRDGLPVEYVFFPGFSGEDDTGRTPLQVEIVNPGTSPVEIGGEVGPEIWLEPESGWNGDPIPAGGAVAVDLFTKRERALTGSPLPRYTFFTVYTRDGGSTRLLVQDNDAVAPMVGRSQLEQADSSFIIPGVVSEQLGNGRRLYSVVTIANVGSADLTTELFYTPDERDGFSGSVRRVEIVVPANDVVRLTDPLGQIFGLPVPARGQIEIRAAQPALRSLNLTARIFTPSSDGIGGLGYRLPVLVRGEGSRQGAPHTLAGLTVGTTEVAELVLAESSGVDDASVAVTLVDASGVMAGTHSFVVPRYGQIRIPNILTTFNAVSPIVGARLSLVVTSGSGSVAGTMIVRDGSRGFTTVSQPSSGLVSSTAAARAAIRLAWPAEMFVHHRRPVLSSSGGSVQYVIPNVISGSDPSFPGNARTTLGITAPVSAGLGATMTLVSASGVQQAQTSVNVGAGQTTEFVDVVRDLFGVQSPFRGMILVDSSSLAALLYARLASTSGAATTTLALPVVVTSSPSITGAGAGERRPVYIDGVEHSISPARGSKWSLVVNEVCNLPVTIEVRLYEAGNRVVPIARKQFELIPFGELRLDTIFTAMELESDLRNKDRINVMVAVVPLSGTGLVSSVAQSIDNVTGTVHTYRLTPAGGIPATGVLLAQPIPLVPVEEEPARRRAVRRP